MDVSPRECSSVQRSHVELAINSTPGLLVIVFHSIDEIRTLPVVHRVADRLANLTEDLQVPPVFGHQVAALSVRLDAFRNRHERVARAALGRLDHVGKVEHHQASDVIPAWALVLESRHPWGWELYRDVGGGERLGHVVRRCHLLLVLQCLPGTTQRAQLRGVTSEELLTST